MVWTTEVKQLFEILADELNTTVEDLYLRHLKNAMDIRLDYR